MANIIDSAPITREVVGSTLKGAGYLNVVHVSPSTYHCLVTRRGHVEHDLQDSSASHASGVLVCINETSTFYACANSEVKESQIQLAGPQRDTVNVAKGDSVDIAPIDKAMPLTSIRLQLKVISSSNLKTVDAKEFRGAFVSAYNRHVFQENHQVVIRYQRSAVRVKVFNLENATGRPLWGKLDGEETSISVESSDTSLRVSGNSTSQSKSVVGAGFNFFNMGIGGLDEEFQTIFRKAFASRATPAAVLEEMGMKHSRGMLLYGPPGCGKTLIARQIGKALKAHPPKIVNGPEVLSKWVGGSEENIRALFAEAEAEQAERGDESDLHIIIFDEIDAICKARGSTRDGTGVHDSVVNQLLSKIDGVDSLNNILLIGMTNRRDMLDEALLRPGRLDIHVEIGLPNEHGREQIFNIHTATMRSKGRIDAAVKADYWAAKTKNYTGAEIAGLVQTAQSFVLQRHTNDDMEIVDHEHMKLTATDFENAFRETRPAFGLSEGALTNLYRLGVYDWGEDFRLAQASLEDMIKTLKVGEHNLASVMLHGAPGSGKTAVAAKFATESGFPFVKRLAADTLIGQGEHGKQQALIKTFQDAYKSEKSLIIIDDIDLLMEYVDAGPRFSNVVLQTLRVLCKTPPPDPTHKLFVIATTSQPRQMAKLGLGRAGSFDTELKLPSLTTKADIKCMLQCVGEGRKARLAKRAAAAGTGEDESKEASYHDEFFGAAHELAEVFCSNGELARPWSVKPLLRVIDSALHKSSDPVDNLQKVLTLQQVLDLSTWDSDY